MVDQEISVFDIYEYLPHSNCGNCGENNCMALAQKLLEGKKTIGGCAPLREDIFENNRKKIQDLIKQL
ncbi:(Fe-S)-binding protein [Acetobacterium tundrae]|uniref:4Fe-4S domain-containing protein n=1 Tax=Acetobacterium tundrae TaxID=132932 RepID=A0ABR6WID5_9FIRM|nr:(Fe-S)-binding protein [Acetobacterium tundrae]MBC3796262.1 hypothetical protein [Acetobacterium tundrae]